MDFKLNIVLVIGAEWVENQIMRWKVLIHSIYMIIKKLCQINVLLFQDDHECEHFLWLKTRGLKGLRDDLSVVNINFKQLLINTFLGYTWQISSDQSDIQSLFQFLVFPAHWPIYTVILQCILLWISINSQLPVLNPPGK